MLELRCCQVSASIVGPTILFILVSTMFMVVGTREICIDRAGLFTIVDMPVSTC